MVEVINLAMITDMIEGPIVGKKFSDLDLAIDAGRKLTSREVGYFKDAFDISDLAYRVDILDINDVRDYLKKIIRPAA